MVCIELTLVYRVMNRKQLIELMLLFLLIVRVHLWDLSGNDEYYDTRIDLYGKTDGVFIAFDVTSQASFEGASRWYDEVCKACTPLPAIFLCGCKVCTVYCES